MDNELEIDDPQSTNGKPAGNLHPLMQAIPGVIIKRSFTCKLPHRARASAAA